MCVCKIIILWRDSVHQDSTLMYETAGFYFFFTLWSLWIITLKGHSKSITYIKHLQRLDPQRCLLQNNMNEKKEKLGSSVELTRWEGNGPYENCKILYEEKTISGEFCWRRWFYMSLVENERIRAVWIESLCRLKGRRLKGWAQRSWRVEFPCSVSAFFTEKEGKAK